MADVGFTANPFSKSGITLEERIRTFRSLGATAIELMFVNHEDFFEFKLTDGVADGIRKYRWISVHAPERMRYSSDSDTMSVIEKIKFLCGRFPVRGIVVHPNLVDDFKVLEDSGLPFLLENMDKRRDSGILPEHFEKLKSECKLGFVFDPQHAYEHDHSMKIAKDILSVMKDRLSHIHISGCTESERHCPVNSSENRDAIIKILEMGIKVPKILEGCHKVLSDKEALSRELAFVKRYEEQD